MTPIEPTKKNDLLRGFENRTLMAYAVEMSRLERELLEIESEIDLINQRKELKGIELKVIRNEIERNTTFEGYLNDDCCPCTGCGALDE